MMISKGNLFNIIDKFNKYNILVIGDIILDEYVWGKANRLSPEAPVPVLEVSKYKYILGGAANVANNIAALGGNAILAGVIGDDIQGNILFDLFKTQNIDGSPVIRDNKRPSTVKTRLIAHNHQQLARADREVKDPIKVETENQLLKKISNIIDKIDLIVLSDYAKGVLTPKIISDVVKMAKSQNKPVLVDPKGLDFTKYQGTTLITPNRLESEMATKSPSGTAPEVLANLIYDVTKAEHVLITLGEDGISLFSNNKIKTVPAVTSEVYDVTGAGDSLISTVALGIPASGGDIETSVVLGNYAAGVAVRKTGTTVVSPDELKEIIELDLRKKESVRGSKDEINAVLKSQDGF